jgi:hypothetical protein
MLVGWVRTLQAGNARASKLPAHEWPWSWTYAVVLEERWRQIQELSVWDDDEVGVPKEYWHDQKRVDAWVADMKQKRKEKYNA